ncbi:Cuticle protein AM1199 [Chionoecetes opilio]|uniref:Cuticle protein AM1199 n=1 Tax=Chionoecetes opilio TaxID=41210 RepID=A0A8J4YKS3_CHIOP|nr:Cuticle protein AM1199 [Chionoecetes opilio]
MDVTSVAESAMRVSRSRAFCVPIPMPSPSPDTATGTTSRPDTGRPGSSVSVSSGITPVTSNPAKAKKTTQQKIASYTYVDKMTDTQTVIIACLAAAAFASPQFSRFFPGRFRTSLPAPVPTPAPRYDNYRPIAILKDERENYGDGNFRYSFETENGIQMSAVGTPGSRGQSNIQGSYR